MENERPKLNLMIVEDHQLFRDGLKAILAFREDLEVVAEARDGLEAYRLFQRKPVDLILMDISMPKRNGIGVVRDVKSLRPETIILVLTIHESDEYIAEAFEAGADGYCIKEASREELLMAIDSVVSGKQFVSPGIAESIVEGYLERNNPSHGQAVKDTLSRREREVLQLIGEGLQNRDISVHLNISIKTVEKHRANLMKKLGLHNATALATYAARKGIIAQTPT